MREAFQGELAQLVDQLARMADRATEAMRHASQALATNDLTLAEQVLSADADLDAERNTCEKHAEQLLALQAPVATDLRTILATLYCTVKIERMGDLAAHVADIVRHSYPQPAVPTELHSSFTTLSELTETMATRLHELITGVSGDGFAKLNDTDEAVDAICTRLIDTITGGEWPHGVHAATNLALLVRFYERFADQAVAVARRLDFAATGILPEHPR